jgi:hypothetical protein
MITSAVVVILATAVAYGKEAKPIPAAELQKRGVSGRLSRALGTIVTVKGTVVANRSRRKADAGVPSVLRIAKVNGKRLKQPVTYRFRLAHDWVKVPAPKVGQKFHLIGFETGAFVGSPEGEFKHVPAYTTTGFHFETTFLVLAVKK